MCLVVVASLKFVINQKRKWLRVKVKVVWMALLTLPQREMTRG